MEQSSTFEVLSDGLILLVMAVVLIVLYGGWFASYRTPKTAPVGTSLWFRLPAWGQIAAGLVISAVGAYGSYLLWLPIPILLSSGVLTVLRIAGLLVVLSSALLFLWGRYTLGAMYNASTSSAVQLHSQHRLIQHGPFAYVRHPIYLSYWLMLLGLLVIYRTWMPLLTLLLIWISLIKRARREEQVLAATFGQTWQAYAQRVPMFLPHWPGVKSRPSEGRPT